MKSWQQPSMLGHTRWLASKAYDAVFENQQIVKMAKRKRSSGHPDEGREQQAKRPKTTIAPPSETLVSSKHKKHAQKAQKRKDQARDRRASEPELGEGTQSKTKAEKSLGKDSKKHDASENGEAPKAKPKRKRKRQGVHQTEQNLTIAVESKVDHASPIATETRVISKPLIAAESEGRLESPIELDLTNRHQSPKAEKATQATDPGKATVRAAKYAQKRAKKIKRKEEKAGERQSEGVKQPPKWAWVQSTGGQMLDADPIFSLDEEYKTHQTSIQARAYIGVDTSSLPTLNISLSMLLQRRYHSANWKYGVGIE